jgi:hypothetical protein
MREDRKGKYENRNRELASFWLDEIGVGIALVGGLGCSVPDLLLEAEACENERDLSVHRCTICAALAKIERMLSASFGAKKLGRCRKFF